jgi:hypothetical protein
VAWVEYEDEVGAGWRVTVVDGQFDEGLVLTAFRKRHPEARIGQATTESIAETAAEARRAFRSQMAARGHKGPYCDIFVLQPPGSGGSERQDSTPLLRYFPAAGTVALVQIERGCPHYRTCLEATARSIGMRNTPEQGYGDADGYRQAVRGFAADLLTPYIAPCMIAEEKIRGYGFDCCPE